MRIGVGTPSVSGMSLLSRLEWIKSHGAEEVELYCCPNPASLAGIWFRTITTTEKTRVLSALEDFGEVDFHGPFQNTFDVSLVSVNPLLRKLTIEEISLVIDFAAERNAGSVVTCHTGWATYGTTEQETESFLVESLQQLSDRADRAGVRIGLEVADYFMPADRFSLLEELQLPAIGITLDTGHISFTSDGRTMYHSFGTIGGFIRRFRDILFHIHIHDYDGDHDHLPIGAGRIDFEDIFSALEEIGYGGTVSLELNPHSTSPDEVSASLDALKALRDKIRRQKRQ